MKVDIIRMKLSSLHCKWGVFHSDLQRIDSYIHGAIFDFLDLLSDADQSLAKPVQLYLVFRLCGLNHQCPCHWP